ncbi:MAG: hypothetical protein A4C66_04140 [Nitrospira sp. HN-bin3]|uniref:hypothetical protein n=1 Tax=Nitrospira cf. moscoviensis SBR1015 TaxID=96242 RepID=UPI000A0D3B52|nr:hypothetical protein [Nitrospira cf. moscoviensis SBR1015]OQW33322.1 MAG: hypothetical protein A4C66_04140 [Nitrospira sp. HN-bin3]
MTDTPKPLRYADVLRDSAAQLDALASELDALAHELALVHRPGEQRAYRTLAAALRRLAELCEECERPKPGDARTVGLACITLCDLIAAGYQGGAE